jgi:hypothetical protein
VRLDTGAFVCMACGAKGGDVLAYHRAAYGLDFVEAAKALGAYHEDAKPYSGPTKPAPIPAKHLLQAVAFEAFIVCLVANELGKGNSLSEIDRQRLTTATGRIHHISEIANA